VCVGVTSGGTLNTSGHSLHHAGAYVFQRRLSFETCTSMATGLNSCISENHVAANYVLGVFSHRSAPD